MYLNEKGEPVDAKNVNDESATSSCASDAESGLFIQSRTGEIVRVELPRGACGFQIGEATQIQSGNLFRATPHAVRMGRAAKGLTRETFALFMQPNRDDPLEFPEGGASTADDSQAPAALLGVVPLEQRWKPGQTFGEFHEATLSAFTIKRAGGF
jgi:isopenicillin N synthase-like dioxygenase